MELTAIALQGLEAAQGQLERSAERLSRAGEMSPDGAPVDPVDLSGEAVALLSARNNFETNARVLETADEMQRQVLDLFG